jgi:hypothetical protein
MHLFHDIDRHSDKQRKMVQRPMMRMPRCQLQDVHGSERGTSMILVKWQLLRCYSGMDKASEARQGAVLLFRDGPV